LPLPQPRRTTTTCVNTDGTTTSIEAGFFASETDWGIAGGYVTYQGEIAEYHTHDFHDGY